MEDLVLHSPKMTEANAENQPLQQMNDQQFFQVLGDIVGGPIAKNEEPKIENEIPQVCEPEPTKQPEKSVQQVPEQNATPQPVIAPTTTMQQAVAINLPQEIIAPKQTVAVTPASQPQRSETPATVGMPIETKAVPPLESRNELPTPMAVVDTSYIKLNQLQNELQELDTMISQEQLDFDNMKRVMDAVKNHLDTQVDEDVKQRELDEYIQQDVYISSPVTRQLSKQELINKYLADKERDKWYHHKIMLAQRYAEEKRMQVEQTERAMQEYHDKHMVKEASISTPAPTKLMQEPKPATVQSPTRRPNSAAKRNSMSSVDTMTEKGYDSDNGRQSKTPKNRWEKLYQQGVNSKEKMNEWIQNEKRKKEREDTNFEFKPSISDTSRKLASKFQTQEPSWERLLNHKSPRREKKNRSLETVSNDVRYSCYP